jgi:hypothetical protein
MGRAGSSALETGIVSAAFSAGETSYANDPWAGMSREHVGEGPGTRSAEHRSAVEYCVNNDLI